MVAGEIVGAVTSIKAALDIIKAMAGLRDAEAFRAKSIELQGVVLDAFEKAIEARQAHSAQIDRIRFLEKEIETFKTWDAEKQRFELKSLGTGALAYVLKPGERGTEPPHWLCPNCFAQGYKSFFQSRAKLELRRLIFDCVRCKGTIAMTEDASKWPD